MLIEISAAAICGGFVGYFACAAMTMSKVDEADAETEKAYEGLGREHLAAWNAIKAHDRCADALTTKQARIDRALAVETPKAAHGVRKMAAILRGDA